MIVAIAAPAAALGHRARDSASSRWAATAATSLHVSGDAVDRGCPQMCTDPTQDPRMTR
ncbi:hypothetical protein [Actinomadura nitritigenes]|uniref:hypothetical protein n=1 Tax=Actinomadura nitritigenes TaxID=134602 RepID=UPI003D9328F9